MPPHKKQSNLIIDSKKDDTENNTANSLDKFFGDDLVTHKNLNDSEPMIQQTSYVKQLSSSPPNDISKCGILLSHSEIRTKIDKLNEDELSEVFRIIKNAGEKYTINKNGIFVNLNSLKEDTISNLSSFLIFCERNNRLINEDERNREIYKQLVNHD